jgi:hypothetical protein
MVYYITKQGGLPLSTLQDGLTRRLRLSFDKMQDWRKNTERGQYESLFIANDGISR